MKKMMIGAMVMAIVAAAFAANPPGFTDDYDAALKRAATEQKPILAVFSGSDWCHWCKVLEKDFLSKPEFTAAVKDNLVLLFVDSPQDDSILSEKAKKRNPELTKKYGIRGFPTLMFLNSKGEKVMDAERQKMEPGEWGKYLVEQSKKMDVLAKHVMPFKDKIEQLFGGINQEAQKIYENKKLSDDERKAEFTKLVAKIKDGAKKIQAEVNAYKFPAELEQEKAELVGMLESVISSNSKEEK